MKMLLITMPDGTVWGVPVDVIADDRAGAYCDEFDGDRDRSLNEDTLPLFKADPYEIIDWAANNMNWDDVKSYARIVADHMPPAVDYQEGWMNGAKEVRDIS